MTRVKILLEDGESQLDAETNLAKAINHHASGDVHEEDSFDDPAMVHTAQYLEAAHAIIYSKMIQEIIEVLNEDFSSGNE